MLKYLALLVEITAGDVKMPIRTLAVNFTSILSANAFSRVISLVYIIMLSRYLGAADIGVYGTLFAYISFGNVIADFGINRMLVRDIARTPTSAQGYLDKVVSLRLILSAVSFMIWLAAIAWMGYSDERVLQLAPVALLSILPYSLGLTFDGVLRAWERMRPAATAIIAYEASKLLFLLLIIQAHYQLTAVLWSLVLSFVIYVVWLGVILHRAGLHIRCRVLPRQWRELLPLSFPFALLGALEMMHGRLDQVLLKALVVDPAQAGYYFNAHRIMDVTLILPAAVSIVLVPRFARNLAAKARRVKTDYYKMLGVLAMVGSVVAMAVYWLGPWALRLVFGVAFAPAGPVLQILTISIFFFFLHYANVTFLIASDLQWKIFALSLIQVAINLVANLILIPRLGMYGSAWANVMSTITGFVVFYFLVKGTLDKTA